MKGSESRLKGSEGRLKGSEGQSEGSEAWPEKSEGQLEEGHMDQRTDRISSHSTGLRPLPGPLPKKALLEH